MVVPCAWRSGRAFYEMLRDPVIVTRGIPTPLKFYVEAPREGTRRRWAEFGQSDVAENRKGRRSDPLGGGDKGDRTPDLVNAIHALSQLSYIPV